MEKYIIDFEASGVHAQIAKPYQLAALKYDDDITKWTVDRWYFATQTEIPFAVQQITHLTKDIVNKRSNGLTFSEQYNDFKHIFRSGNVMIGHNIMNYDRKLLISTLKREGLPSLGFVKVIDTMLDCKYYPFVKNRSGRVSKDNALIDLANYNGMDIKSLQDYIFSILKSMGISEEECHSHNACYDVYATALLYHFGKDYVPMGGALNGVTGNTGKA